MSTDAYTNGFQTAQDRLQELKAFDDTKTGVKGLVDAGVESLPKIFIRPPDELLEESKTPCVQLQLPVIDLSGIDEKDRYSEIVKEVLKAAEEWGFFQVVNHGVPLEILDMMIEGIRLFYEQDDDVKKQLYSRDFTKQVTFLSSFDLYTSRAANWRDSLAVQTLHADLDPQQLPPICRDVMLVYIDHVLKLADNLLELVSVALGLRPDYLKEMECSKGWSLVNHYYPACPEPELTLGASKHTDPTFLTILLQDHIGGLQVLHKNQWVDVPPLRGAFIVNIGDMLQIMSNDKLKSVHHRVIANRVGPRISTAFLLKGRLSSPRLYGPIAELLSENDKPVYTEFTLREFASSFYSRPLDEPGLGYYKVRNNGDGK